MPIVRKVLLKPGLYYTRQGAVNATRERIASWVDSFQRMKQNKIRIPVPWGHQPEALPDDGSSLSRSQFAVSKYNAGFVVDMKQDSEGSLVGILDLPGVSTDNKGDLVYDVELSNGAKTKGKIGEVSIAVKDWVDGKGTHWKDSIVHVALTPLPVWHGQDGFDKLFSVKNEPKDAIYLSLSDASENRKKQVREEVRQKAGAILRQLKRFAGKNPTKSDILRLMSLDLSKMANGRFRSGSVDVIQRFLASVEAAKMIGD